MTAEELMALSATISGPVFGALAGALGAYYFGNLSERKRRLLEAYASAYQDVLSWQEMVFVILRRAPGSKIERAIIERMHELQQKLIFHQGWIGCNSLWVSRSYRTLVKTTQSELAPYIQKAWQERLSPSWASPKQLNELSASRLKIDQVAMRFTRDVRLSHAPVWLFPLKIVPVFCNIHWRWRSNG